MNVELSWMLGTGFAILASGIGGYIKLTERVSRVEAVLSMVGEKAAKILHSPHTPELDTLLEKYLDRHYELSHEEWTQLLVICDKIVEDKSKPKEDRVLAAILSVITHHKLMHPPPLKKSIDDRLIEGETEG